MRASAYSAHAALVDAGLDGSPPDGAYYIQADFSALSDEPWLP